VRAQGKVRVGLLRAGGGFAARTGYARLFHGIITLTRGGVVPGSHELLGADLPDRVTVER